MLRIWDAKNRKIPDLVVFVSDIDIVFVYVVVVVVVVVVGIVCNANDTNALTDRGEIDFRIKAVHV